MSLTTHERRFGHPDPYRNLVAAMIWRAVADTRSEDRRLANGNRSVH